MTQYTYAFREKFAVNYAQYVKEQRDCVLKFIAIYKERGLTYAHLLPGKLTCSSTTLLVTDPDFVYAKDNWLWHYHVGYPTFEASKHGYHTSDFVLHFQWPHLRDHIELVDLCSHNSQSGRFRLPPPEFLISAKTSSVAVDSAENSVAAESALSTGADQPGA